MCLAHERLLALDKAPALLKAHPTSTKLKAMAPDVRQLSPLFLLRAEAHHLAEGSMTSDFWFIS